MKPDTTTITALIAVALLVFSLFAFATAHERGSGETGKTINTDARDTSHTVHGSIEPVDAATKGTAQSNAGKAKRHSDRHKTSHDRKTSQDKSKTSPGDEETAVKTVFRGCSEVWYVFTGDVSAQFPATLNINGEVRTVTQDDLTYIPGQFGDTPVYKFNVHEHYGQDAKIRAVTVDGETRVNDHTCADTPDKDGTQDEEKDDETKQKQEDDKQNTDKEKKSKKPDTPVKKGQDKKSENKPETPVKKGKDTQDKKQKKGQDSSCQQDVEDAQNYAEGRACTQQIQQMQCPYDQEFEYTARNGCEISFLKERGWTEADTTMTESTSDSTTESTDQPTNTADSNTAKDDTTQDKNTDTTPDKKQSDKKGTDQKLDKKSEKVESDDKCHVHEHEHGSKTKEHFHCDGDNGNHHVDDKKKQKKSDKTSSDKKKDAEKEKSEKKPDTPVKDGKDKQKEKKPDKKQEMDRKEDTSSEKDKKGSEKTFHPCSKYCDVTIDDIVENVKKLKQYVDWKTAKEVEKHEERYDHSQLHPHDEQPKKGTKKHDHSAYLTKDEATNIFAAKDHEHAESVPEHDHPVYAPVEHTRPELAEQESSSGGHDHTALKQELKQYVDAQSTANGVKDSLHRDMRGLAYQMKNWAESTFARKNRVQKMEQEQHQMRKELDYLKHATGYTGLDTDTAAHMMADGNYSRFVYDDTTCSVYQNTNGNQTGPKKVQCIR